MREKEMKERTKIWHRGAHKNRGEYPRNPHSKIVALQGKQQAPKLSSGDRRPVSGAPGRGRQKPQDGLKLIGDAVKVFD